MAILADFTRFLLQQVMVEMSLQPETFDAGMIAMARHAILADQLLVERRRGQRFDDGQASRR